VHFRAHLGLVDATTIAANFGKVRHQATYDRHDVGSDLYPPPLQGECRRFDPDTGLPAGIRHWLNFSRRVSSD
jgi:hypothetical protein